MEGRAKEPGGPHVPDRAKLADFVKVDNALRSIQIIQDDGTFIGYNQDADIRDFPNPMDSSLHNLARVVRRSGNVSITPSMEVGTGSKTLWCCVLYICLMKRETAISGDIFWPLLIPASS